MPIRLSRFGVTFVTDWPPMLVRTVTRYLDWSERSGRCRIVDHSAVDPALARALLRWPDGGLLSDRSVQIGGNHASVQFCGHLALTTVFGSAFAQHLSQGTRAWNGGGLRSGYKVMKDGTRCLLNM